MNSLIVPDALADNSVCGVRQMQYTVNGKSGQNFIDAVAMASFRQAVAIEDTTSSYAAVVRARQVKINELAEALSYVAKAVGSLDHDAKSSTKTTVSNASRVKEIANKYGVSLSWDGNKMEFGNLQKAKTNLQYAIDREDNDIQQDIVTLQSFITKRDNAYSNAAKVITKANHAASSTIGNIGS